MNPHTRIRALVFDAYGTLFDVHSLAGVCDEVFPGHGAAISQMWRAKQLEYMFLRSLMNRYVPHDENTEAALIYVCATRGLDCLPATRARLMEAYLRLDLFPDAKEALSKLSGYTRAILSVGTLPMIQSIVRHAGVEKAFDQLISVDAVKIYKPAMAVYQLTQDRLGMEKAEIGFVTSNYFDVAGAKTFGFPTFWVNRIHAPPDELGVLPDATISSLAELPALLAMRADKADGASSNAAARH